MGFEPTPPKRLVPKTSALDRSAIQPVAAFSAAGWAVFVSSEKCKKVTCAGRESNPGLVRGRDVYYHYTTGAAALLSIPRLELGASRVLGERHDQLDHTD